MKRVLPLLLLVAAPATAADRAVSVTDFDRLRVEGPYVVHLVRGTPSARIAGSRAAADAVELRVEGTTLIVRVPQQTWGERASAGAPDAPVVTLRTLALRSVTLLGGAKVDIAGALRGERIELQIAGDGEIAASGIDAQQLNATVDGAGTMTLAGRAARARLLSTGAATIQAGALHADALVLRVDGTGATRASARYSADVVTTGLGSATVYGKPRCTVKSVAGGPIACGVAAPTPAQ